VIAGNVPTKDGTFGTIGAGSLQIIDRFGHVVQTLIDASTNLNLFDGPWASAVNFDANQPSELIEFSTAGQFVGELSLDHAVGAAFELVVLSTRHTVTVVTVNDDLSTLDFRTITR